MHVSSHSRATQRLTMCGRTWVFVAVLALFCISGCDRAGTTDGARPGAADRNVLRLATTTSTRDSGLLDVLLPVFEAAHDARVDVVAVGTGAALRLGEAGDADVLLVHAREAEEAFMEAGHGIRHEEIMFNHFTILGPPDDPAGIDGFSATDALRKIAQDRYRFLSRGDDSGTHKREMQLWEAAGGLASWRDYIESGQGMGPTLIMADELRGHVLSDMGTYLAMRDRIDLRPLVPPEDALRNPYAVIVVNPDKNQRINADLADAFVEFLISPEAQRLIADFQVDGRQLFHPTRIDEPQTESRLPSAPR